MDGTSVSAAPSQLRQGAVERGRGWSRLEKIAPNPASGSYTYTVDGTFWRRLLSVGFTFTASATAASRSLSMAMADGDGFVFNSTLVAAGIQANQIVTAYGDLQATSPAEVVSSVTGSGSVTSPAAAATIATTPSVPAGAYLVSAVANLAGTLAQGTDNSNLQIVPATGAAITLPNEIAAGDQPFGPYNIDLTAAGTVALKTIGAGSTGSIYAGQLALSPQPFPGAFTTPDFIMKSGWQYQINVGNAQAGDQLSSVSFLFEQYPSSDVPLRDHSDLADFLVAAAAALGG